MAELKAILTRSGIEPELQSSQDCVLSVERPDHKRVWSSRDDSQAVKLIQGEPDLNWQLRCRRPPCSQLHYPLMDVFTDDVAQPSQQPLVPTAARSYAMTFAPYITSLIHPLNLLLFPSHRPTLFDISSISSASVSHKMEGGFSSTYIASDSIAIWIFTTRSEMIDPLAWSHKPLILISLGIGIWSFQSFRWVCFGSSKIFLLGLLLLGF